MYLCHVIVRYLCDTYICVIAYRGRRLDGRGGGLLRLRHPLLTKYPWLLTGSTRSTSVLISYVYYLYVLNYHVFPASRFEWFLDSDILTAFDITLWTMSLSWDCFVVITDITAQRFLTRYHIWPPPSSWPVDVKWFERLVLLKTWCLIECSRNLIAWNEKLSKSPARRYGISWRC